jgi:hypothetical protein
MVGGAVEYLALLTGFQTLLLLVAGLYVVAGLLATRFRFLGDVALERDVELEGQLAADSARRTASAPAS